MDAKRSCPGCRLTFVTNPGYLSLYAKHLESDVHNITGGKVDERFRFYHLRLNCIQERHSAFNLKRDGQVGLELTWTPSAEEMELIRAFQRGSIY